MNLDQLADEAITACRACVNAKTATEAATRKRVLMDAIAAYMTAGGDVDWLIRQTKLSNEVEA